MTTRNLVLLAICLGSTAAFADDDEAGQSCAVSKEVYDLIMRAEEAGDDTEKTEVPEDFPPTNSQDFQGCFEAVKSLTDDLFLLLQGAAACEKRHPCEQLARQQVM